MVAKEVLSQYFFPNRSFLESNLRSEWSPNKAVKRYLFRDGFCFCHCFGTDFVFGRILFLSLFRDGFCFCYCFGTDFIFLSLGLFFLSLSEGIWFLATFPESDFSRVPSEINIFCSLPKHTFPESNPRSDPSRNHGKNRIRPETV